MVSKKSCEIVNSLNIPMFIYEYQTEHTCISVCFSPVLCHRDNWWIKFSTHCQDPYDGYRMKQVCVEKEFDPITDELFLEKEVRCWIEELFDYVEKVRNKEVKIGSSN